MKITFYGASDDLIEVDGAPGADEFGAWHGGNGDTINKMIEIVGTPVRCEHCDVTGPAPVLAVVYALYTARGVWTFAPVMPNHLAPWPRGWTVTMEQYQDTHSMLLTIDTDGDDVSIRVLEDKP